ncbi:HDOD domain-containing protein [Alkaliphilus transvaalensis]|uniref:HDOD domain-containing protein n=1 Tax=Alkaliphilus transvaalensis TaxID=114628 RepID=UPI00047DB4BB|nr:HDOD domain-containing protein [Alkaliphilus transvaalensis]
MESHTIINEIKKSNHLPQMPKSIGDVFTMVLNPEEFEVDHFICKVTDHPKLESLLIQYLNSPYFRLNREIENIRDAIIYLGINNVKLIVISFITRLLLPDKKGRTKTFNHNTYWKHCIGTSIASFMIAEYTGISDKQKMFTYGLIHDIGITVLDICLPEHLDKIHELQLKGLHQIAAEKIVLGGKTHADIGMWLCKEWGLPIEIAEVVGFHHGPTLSKENVDEVKLLYLADSISTNYYERLLGNDKTFTYSDKIMKAIGVTKEQIDTIIKRLPKEIEKVNRVVNFEPIDEEKE